MALTGQFEVTDRIESVRAKGGIKLHYRTKDFPTIEGQLTSSRWMDLP